MEYILLFFIITIPIMCNYFTVRYIDEYMEPYYRNICIWIYPIFVVVVGILLSQLLRLSEGFEFAIFLSFPYVGLIFYLRFSKQINKINSIVYGILILAGILFSLYVVMIVFPIDLLKVTFRISDSLFLNKVIFAYTILIVYGIFKGIIFLNQNKDS